MPDQDSNNNQHQNDSLQTKKDDSSILCHSPSSFSSSWPSNNDSLSSDDFSYEDDIYDSDDEFEFEDDLCFDSDFNHNNISDTPLNDSYESHFNFNASYGGLVADNRVCRYCNFGKKLCECLPFWFNMNDSDYAHQICNEYIKFLQVDTISRKFEHFIGRIKRERVAHAGNCFMTFDTVNIYRRTDCPIGSNLKSSEEAFLLTRWDNDDGYPQNMITIKFGSDLYEFWKGRTVGGHVSYIHCLPKYNSGTYHFSVDTIEKEICQDGQPFNFAKYLSDEQYMSQDPDMDVLFQIADLI